jgi:hypothetical protein
VRSILFGKRTCPLTKRVAQVPSLNEESSLAGSAGILPAMSAKREKPASDP